MAWGVGSPSGTCAALKCRRCLFVHPGASAGMMPAHGVRGLVFDSGRHAANGNVVCKGILGTAGKSVVSTG